MIALLALLSLAQAEDNAVSGARDIELFRPAGDTMGYFAVPSASTLGNLQLGLSLWSSYATDPLVIEVDGARVSPDPASAEGDQGDALVDDRLGMNVQAGMGFGRFTSVVVDLPLIAYQDGLRLDALTAANTGGTALSAGLGDLRVIPKAVALRDDDAPVGLAVLLPISLPTGGEGDFSGDPGLGVAPQLVVEKANKPVSSQAYTTRAAATLGYQVRRPARLRDLRLGNELLWGAAFAYHPVHPVELIAEAHGAVGGSTIAQNPAELLAGARFFAGELVSARIAGGGGLIPGVGAPDWRVAAGLSVAPNFDPNARDADEDGVSDGVDRCIKEPEDKDKFKDADGCPDLDNDADTIPDTKDQCPDDPEDNDGYRDDDGCADNDNDGDQIPDSDDRCAFDPETYNGVQDTDGCPDQATKDTDGDRYTDDIDRCPYDAEDYDGDQDQDGCPDEGRVQVGKDRIKISEVIYFDTGKDSIQERSNSLLDELARVIVAHTELTKIRIEGHTDDVGNDTGNLKLSDARARAVRAALIARGVDGARLDARGFGEMYPLVPNSSEEARAQNRRVEFVIVDSQN